MPIPSLPLELIGKIIDEIPTELYHNTSEHQIASLCLVSKSFLPFARERLYSKDYLRLDNEDCDTEGPQSTASPWQLDVRSSRLSATLTLTPHVASLVRYLSLDLEHANDPAEAHEMVKDIVSSCAQLEGLRIDVPIESRWGSLELDEVQLEPAIACARKLKKLRIWGRYWELDGLHEMLLLLKGLQKLTLGATMNEPETEWEGFVFEAGQQPSFQLLALDLGGLFAEPRLLQHLSSSKPTLTELRLAHPWAAFAHPWAAFDLSNFTALRKLTIDGAGGGIGAQLLLETIESPPALEELFLPFLRFRFHPAGFFLQLEKSRFLHRLPRSLLHLHDTESIYFTSEYLLQVADDRRLLPRLKSVRA